MCFQYAFTIYKYVNFKCMNDQMNVRNIFLCEFFK